MGVLSSWHLAGGQNLRQSVSISDQSIKFHMNKKNDNYFDKVIIVFFFFKFSNFPLFGSFAQLALSRGTKPPTIKFNLRSITSDCKIIRLALASTLYWISLKYKYKNTYKRDSDITSIVCSRFVLELNWTNNSLETHIFKEVLAFCSSFGHLKPQTPNLLQNYYCLRLNFWMKYATKGTKMGDILDFCGTNMAAIKPTLHVW